MIFTERTIKVTNGASQINSPVVLYKGDKNIKIRFKIVDCPYTYSKNVDNIIEVSEASYAQLVIKTPNDGLPIFSDIAETESGYVTFTITGEMIDEAEEVGKYSFQVRLLDNEQFSRITIPEVVDGIEVRDPIAIEGVSATNEVDIAMVNYAVTTAAAPEDTFDSQGNYNKTTWGAGDRITAAKLNKIEAGIDGVNQKVASGGTGGTVDLTGYAKITDLPTKTSQLTNDSGYITNIPNEYITETELNAKGYATTSQIPTVPTNVSSFTNDANYASETFVTNKIAEASLSGGEVDLSRFQTKDDDTINGTDKNIVSNINNINSQITDIMNNGVSSSKSFDVCETPIPLPTQKICDGQVTHPSIVCVPENLYSNFNGARYILAVTPLPYYNTLLENPTIFGTLNHKEFFNLSNGAIDTPTEGNRIYLSDPCLVFVGDTLECWYREADEVNSTETICRKTSTNGKTWTEREVLFESTGGVKKHLSPAVLYEDGTYKIWTNSSGTINYYTSADGTNWQFVKSFAYDNWHFSVKHTSRGYEIICCAADGNIHYAVFNSETDWDRSASNIVIRKGNLGNIGDNGLYHTSLVVDSSDNYYVYFGANSVDNRWNTCLMTGTYNEGTLDLVPVNFFDNRRHLYASDTINTKTVYADSLKPGNGSYTENEIKLYSSAGTVRLFNNNYEIETTNKFKAGSYGIQNSNERINVNSGGYISISNNPIQTIRNGATTSRPSSPVIGMFFFDTTLGLPIWWNGTDWVKYDGTNADTGEPPTTNIPVTGVTLNRSTYSLNVGSSVTLSATISPNNATNKNVEWSSNNSNVTVNNGVVTGNTEGEAIVTVTTTDGGYTASCTITITANTGGDTETDPDIANAITTISYNLPTDGLSTYNNTTCELNLVSTGKYTTFAITYDSTNFNIGSNYNICFKVLERTLNEGHSLGFATTWAVTGISAGTIGNLATCDLNTTYKKQITIQENAKSGNIVSIVFNSASATNSALKTLIWIEPVV